VVSQSSNFWGAHFGVNSKCLSLYQEEKHVRTMAFNHLLHGIVQHADTRRNLMTLLQAFLHVPAADTARLQDFGESAWP